MDCKVLWKPRLECLKMSICLDTYLLDKHKIMKWLIKLNKKKRTDSGCCKECTRDWQSPILWKRLLTISLSLVISQRKPNINRGMKVLVAFFCSRASYSTNDFLSQSKQLFFGTLKPLATNERARDLRTNKRKDWNECLGYTTEAIPVNQDTVHSARVFRSRQEYQATKTISSNEFTYSDALTETFCLWIFNSLLSWSMIFCVFWTSFSRFAALYISKIRPFLSRSTSLSFGASSFFSSPDPAHLSSKAEPRGMIPSYSAPPWGLARRWRRSGKDRGRKWRKGVNRKRKILKGKG